MARRNRTTLRKYFARGKMPTEEHFSDLIDSMLNILEEGFDKSPEKGMSLAPLDEEGHVISIFRKIEDEEQKWTVSLEKSTENLIVKKFDGQPVFALNQDGQVGFGTAAPQHQLHTTGMAGLYGRTGTFDAGQVAADGKWHTISDPLNGCYAFEVIAGSGKPGEGKYALLIATAIQCFGAHRRIYTKQSWYGIRCNKIRLRWKNENGNCFLQIKTRCNYDPGTMISYNISSLWDNHRMAQQQTVPASDGE